MNDEAIRAYLERRQTQSSAGETLKAHLARLRLQSAREKANKERRAYRPPSLDQHIAYSNYSPGIVYYDAQERESSRSAAQRAQPNLAGPVAKSWSQQHAATFQRQRESRLHDPSESLQSILVLERAALLATLHQPFHPSAVHVSSLLDHCLLSILLNLLSVNTTTLEEEMAGDAQPLVDALSYLPTHLKQRLMWQAQTVAPLPPLALKALFLSCTDQHRTGSPVDIDDWESQDDDSDSNYNSPDDPLTALHLAFSPLTSIHLRDGLNSIQRTAVTRLDLTHTPNIALGQVLLGLLPLLPNLAELSLASKEIKSNILSPPAFLSKLSLAAPLLRTLDLSFSNWVGLPALEGVNWHDRWLELKQLGLRGTPASGQTDSARLDAARRRMMSAPRSGTLGEPNACVRNLEHSATPRNKHTKEEKSPQQLIEEIILRKRGPSQSIRPWVHVVL